MQRVVGYPLLVEALAPPRGLARGLVMALLVIGGSAFTALCAQFRIDLPFTPVPITGQTFAVLLLGAVLGSRLGAASLLLYMLEGSAGLLWGSRTAGFPVFAGGTAGWATIAGPTGGYIVGFVAAAYVTGWLAERGFDRRPWSLALAMAVGNVTVYVFGLPWLDHFFPGQALKLGLYPFIPGDAAKLLLAASLVPVGRALVARVAPVEEEAAREERPLTLGRYRVPASLLYLGGALLIVAGALLPWRVPGEGFEPGWAQTAGQVALVAGAVGVALVASPLPVMCLAIAGVVALGCLLPFGVLPGEYSLTVERPAAMLALAIVLLAMALLAWRGVPRLGRGEALRWGQFVMGAVAGYASFYQVVQVLLRSEEFAPGDLGAGLLLCALASILLVVMSVAMGQTAAEATSSA